MVNIWLIYGIQMVILDDLGVPFPHLQTPLMARPPNIDQFVGEIHLHESNNVLRTEPVVKTPNIWMSVVIIFQGFHWLCVNHHLTSTCLDASSTLNAPLFMIFYIIHPCQPTVNPWFSRFSPKSANAVTPQPIAMRCRPASIGISSRLRPGRNSTPSTPLGALRCSCHRCRGIGGIGVRREIHREMVVKNEG